MYRAMASVCERELSDNGQTTTRGECNDWVGDLGVVVAAGGRKSLVDERAREKK